jgi:hypothetical protein
MQSSARPQGSHSCWHAPPWKPDPKRGKPPRTAPRRSADILGRAANIAGPLCFRTAASVNARQFLGPVRRWTRVQRACFGPRSVDVVPSGLIAANARTTLVAAIMAPNESVEALGPLPEAAVKALGLKPGDLRSTHLSIGRRMSRTILRWKSKLAATSKASQYPSIYKTSLPASPVRPGSWR